jgi:carbonic anhydrase
MKSKTVTFTAIALSLACLQASAANWREVSVSSDQVVYADTINVLRRGDFVRAWEREVYAREQQGEGLSDPYKSIKVLRHYDCAGQTSMPVIRIYYRKNGSEIRRFRVEGLMPPSVIEPDSPRAVVFKDVCPEAAAQMAKAAAEAAAKSPKNSVALSKPAQQASGKKKAANKATKRRGKSIKRAAVKDQAPPVKNAGTGGNPLAMDEIKWTYSGSNGAENWGVLKPEWAACGNGTMQSPIDISDGARLDLEPIKFQYRLSPLRIVDTGYTVQVNYPGGSAITVGGVRYELMQMHFHKPAEERVNGRVYDMAAHLVHRSFDGRLAVVAVLFEIGEENAFIKSLWPYLPLEKEREVVMNHIKIPVDSLLPPERGYYTFMGSLNTPPCTEGVLWLVMKTPVSISPPQVGVFGRLYPMNARPVQATNGRFIKESR